MTDGQRIAKQKQLLRKRIRALREEIRPEEKADWDEKLCSRFFQLYESDPAGWVYLYMDFRKEAGTGQLLETLWQRGVHAAAPRVEGNEMRFYEIRKPEDLVPGYMGILEPADGLNEASAEKALVLVPGLAFDRDGYRLGYGGGFYDRFFEQEPQHVKWGLAYEFQLVDAVPREAFDRRLDAVLTPKAVYRN